MDVNGSVALVIGGQRGIGRSVVGELLARGASKIYVTAPTPSLDKDPRVVPLAVDVRDDSAVAGLAGIAGDTTIVVNTPGLDRFADPLEGSLASFRRDFDVDVFGLLSVTRAMAPVLGANGGGAMLNILSTLSWTTGGIASSASSAAASSVSDHARAALAAQGTTVTVAHLGRVRSAAIAAHVPQLKMSVLALRAVESLTAGEDEVLLDDIAHRGRSPQVSASTAAGRPLSRDTRSELFEAQNQSAASRIRTSSEAALPPLAVSAVIVHSEAPLALADFWSRVFGVPVNPGSTADSASLMTSPRLPLLAFERSSSPYRPPGGITVRAYTDDLEERIRQLGDRGVHASSSQEQPEDQDLVHINDPEGNRIGIVQLRGRGRDGGPQPLSSDGGPPASSANTARKRELSQSFPGTSPQVGDDPAGGRARWHPSTRLTT